MGTDVAEAMKHDHHEMLEELIQQAKVPSASVETVKKIKWRLQRHFYIEEKLIFSVCRLEGNDNITTLPKLLKEHDDILHEIDIIIQILNQNKNPAWDRIIELKREHIQLESTQIYQKIDEYMDETDKAELIRQIDKIISLGFYPIEKLREYAKDNVKCCSIN
jgi:iron-sulfur cluster repair protein YtfE (RIC family)